MNFKIFKTRSKHRKLPSSSFVFLCGLFSILLIFGVHCFIKSGIVSPFFYTSSESSEKKHTDESEFLAFLDALFQNEVTSDTLSLHYTLADPASAKIVEYPVTLGNISIENKSSELASLENLKSELQTYDTSAMSVSSQITYDVLEDYINKNMETAPYYYYHEPASSTNGVQSEFPILLAEYTFYSKKDIDNYLNLLSQFDTYFNQLCNFEKQKAKKGLFMSEASADNLISQCRAFLPADSEQSFWETTFIERLEGIETLTEAEKSSYIAQNQETLQEHVYPAYHNFIAVLKALKKSGKNAQGLCYFKDGKQYYQALVTSTTGSKRSVAKLQKMVEARRSKNLSERNLLLITGKENHPEIKKASYITSNYQSPEDMIEHLKEQIKTDFPAAPPVNYTIKTVNKKLEDFLAPAFYLTAPMDQYTENCIYINPGSSYSGIGLFTTLAHEGYPGHLYQKVYSYSTQLAPIRHLLYHGGYTEGWAAYVEMLSFDYAGLSKDISRLLMLNQDTTLSLYATIDMGVHNDGWSLADTANFLGSYQVTDISIISNIYQAVIENPANYLKYYIGYLEILNLKSKAKEIYGKDFSELSFHKAILDMGSAPFYILEKYLPKYYKAAK